MFLNTIVSSVCAIVVKQKLTYTGHKFFSQNALKHALKQMYNVIN